MRISRTRKGPSTSTYSFFDVARAFQGDCKLVVNPSFDDPRPLQVPLSCKLGYSNLSFTLRERHFVADEAAGRGFGESVTPPTKYNERYRIGSALRNETKTRRGTVWRFSHLQ